ncbi:MAG TPA: pitrilysin family protein [Polyangia bacterium]|nr:pitrilysin family protein [Polyangia bacterium]
MRRTGCLGGSRSGGGRVLGGLVVLALGVVAGLGHEGPARAKPPAVASDWQKIKAPPLRAFTPEKPRRVVLDNGLVIFLLPDRELPLVSVTIFGPGGSLGEPADKAGLAALFGQSWRSGGTRTRSGDEIDEFLALRAAVVESFADNDSVAITANCLKGDFDDVFQIVAELLQAPEFRQDKLDLAKRQMMTRIARRNDSPQSILQREALKLAYGAGHPFARTPEYGTVAAVTREDLREWHKRYVQPNTLLLGLSGDFDADEMEAKLRKWLGGWPKGPGVPKGQFEFAPTKPGVYFVEKGDVNQANIQLVQLGTTRRNPDFYALEVMNEVLGGGFSARLFSNVRSKKGLAYSVGGGVGLGWEYPATYRLAMGTASKNVVQAVQALYDEVRGMVKNEATAEEVARAKETILNSFVFNFESKASVLSDRMRLEFYGYPPDFTEKYPEAITKVTVEDVRRVAKKYLNPDGFAVLVVGKGAEFGAPLASLGPVTALDITIPPPPTALAAPSPTASPVPPGGAAAPVVRPGTPKRGK